MLPKLTELRQKWGIFIYIYIYQWEQGLAKEREHALCHLINRWEEEMGWDVKLAIQLLWSGQRNEDILCEEADLASQVVVRAALRLVKSMERRLLSG